MEKRPKNGRRRRQAQRRQYFDGIEYFDASGIEPRYFSRFFWMSISVFNVFQLCTKFKINSIFAVFIIDAFCNFKYYNCQNNFRQNRNFKKNLKKKVKISLSFYSHNKNCLKVNMRGPRAVTVSFVGTSNRGMH